MKIVEVISQPGQIQYKTGRFNELYESQIEQIISLIASGGEVPMATMIVNFKRSAKIAFATKDETVIAVRTLKIPNENYKNKVFEAAGIGEKAASFKIELGYDFTLPEYRQQGISSKLGSLLFDGITVPTYATTRSDNAAAIANVKKLGFIQSGTPYNSVRGDYSLTLWIRIA